LMLLTDFKLLPPIKLSTLTDCDFLSIHNLD
jgi:hypothetical protein